MDKISETKKALKIQTVFLYIVIALTLIITFKGMKLAIKYDKLMKENENLKGLTEMQSSIIADLEENLRRNKDV